MVQHLNRGEILDTAISSGDFIFDSYGQPMELGGYEEILQRVLIRLGVKKGSFVYDENLGSRLYTLKSTDKNIREKALSLVREALINIREVIVENVFTTLTNDGENLELNIILSINDQEKEVVITV